jgi:acetoin utilization deacetylase AcuC-like enzyme
VAAGALHAISEEQNLCKRCAIVDIDVHHGNGTEEIVRKCHDPARLLFFSIHLFDHDKKRNRGSPAYGYKFYPGTGEEDDLPLNIINVPIAPLWKEQNDGGSKDATAAPKSTHNTRQKVKQKTASATSSPREWGTGDEGSATEITKASDTESETASKVSKKSATPASSPRYATMGRHAYRRAVQDRLLPALRAFNPDLILISAGFDAAKGDVGNARHFVGGDQRMGLDLEPEDYAWTTRKVCGSQLIAHHALFMCLIPLCP